MALRGGGAVRKTLVEVFQLLCLSDFLSNQDGYIEGHFMDIFGSFGGWATLSSAILGRGLGCMHMHRTM